MKAALATYEATPTWTDVPEPDPAPADVEVRMTAVALHNLTRAIADGRHYASPPAPGFVIGVDGVGVTADGRRVYVSRPGTVAERVRVPESALIELPAGVGDTQAAALVNATLSSWMALTVRARVRPGQTVLVLGATGGSGRPAVRVARHFGARVIAAGRNPHALAQVGADATVDVSVPDDDVISALRAERIDVVLDYLWGRPAELTLRALAGREPATFVQIGTMAGPDITLPGALLRSSDLRLLGSGLGSFSIEEFAAERSVMLAAVAELGIEIPILTVPAAEVADVWRRDPAGRRVVLTF